MQKALSPEDIFNLFPTHRIYQYGMNSFNNNSNKNNRMAVSKCQGYTHTHILILTTQE